LRLWIKDWKQQPVFIHILLMITTLWHILNQYLFKRYNFGQIYNMYNNKYFFITIKCIVISETFLFCIHKQCGKMIALTQWKQQMFENRVSFTDPVTHFFMVLFQKHDAQIRICQYCSNEHYLKRYYRILHFM
jgi:hypothetical protein